MKQGLKKILKLVLVFSLLLMLIYIYRYFGISQILTKENVALYLKPYGNLIPVVYLSLFVIAMVLYIPASIFLITIGTILPPFYGCLLGLIGCYISSMILFLIARKFNLKGIEKKFGNKWQTFNQKIQQDGFLYMTLIRSTSVFSFSMICYASGITSIKTKDYIKGTIIGVIPQIIIYCYIVPTFLTSSFSLDKILNVILFSITWIILFGVTYVIHERKKIKLTASL